MSEKPDSHPRQVPDAQAGPRAEPVTSPATANEAERAAKSERSEVSLAGGRGPRHPNKDRREFLLRFGTGAGIAAIGYQGAASLRSLVPNVSYDAPTIVKVGLPGDFPDGLKFLPDLRLFVFREGKIFHAISAVCTHLGCTVRAEALPQAEQRNVGGQELRLTHRFLCPCHGSRYEGDGTNVYGPAPKPLAWYHLSVAPDDGQLVVDLAGEVDHDFRLTVA